jgi:RuvB-like protein 1 (pontin 52)
MCTIRGTEDIQAPHGIPVDLLDRLLIIRTIPYTLEEIGVIVGIRAKVEGLELADEAKNYLARVGADSSLRYFFLTFCKCQFPSLTRYSFRYAIQLLTPANILARINGRNEIEKEDLEEVNGLFLDAKASARNLTTTSEKYIV